MWFISVIVNIGVRQNDKSFPFFLKKHLIPYIFQVASGRAKQATRCILNFCDVRAKIRGENSFKWTLWWAPLTLDFSKKHLIPTFYRWLLDGHLSEARFIQEVVHVNTVVLEWLPISFLFEQTSHSLHFTDGSFGRAERATR